MLYRKLFFAVLLLIPVPGQATDINGRCYPHPVRLAVNEQPPDSSAAARAANLEWVRITFPWRDLNPSANVYTWGGLDALVNAHVSRGNKVLAILSTAPTWAGSNANGTRPPGSATDTTLWRNFVRETAIHFRGRVKAYEIWNEPNFGDLGTGIGWTGRLFSTSAGTLPTYAQYVQVASAEIRAQAPGTLVVAPVTSSVPDAKTVDVFRSLEVEGASPWIDVVSFHANANDNESTATITGRINSQLSTLGARNPSNAQKPIWITEFGWKSNRVGEAGQRDRIRNIAKFWTREWGLLDYPVACDIHKTALLFIYKDIDTPDSSQGIYRSNGTAKPVVSEYLTTLPAFGVQPAEGYSPDGYRPFSVSCAGRTCTFTSGHADPGDGSRIFDWDFGDGVTATGRVAVRTYAAAGQYHVFHGVTGLLEWPSDARILEVP